MATRIGDRFLMMGEQLNVGLVLVRMGDGAEGEALLRRNLRDHAQIGLIDSNVIWNLWGLAVAATRRGDPRQSARLFGGAARLSETTGFAVAPADRALYEADIAAARAALGQTAFAAAWAEGEAAGWEEIRNYELRTTTAPLTY